MEKFKGIDVDFVEVEDAPHADDSEPIEELSEKIGPVYLKDKHKNQK